jgi:hypothetical protein
VGQHVVAVLELHAEHGVRERLDDRPLQHDGIFLGLGQVNLLLLFDICHPSSGGTTCATDHGMRVPDVTAAGGMPEHGHLSGIGTPPHSGG